MSTCLATCCASENCRKKPAQGAGSVAWPPERGPLPPPRFTGGCGLPLASHLTVSLPSQVRAKQMWESGGSSVALQGRSISKKTGSYRQAGVRVTAGGNRKFCVYFQFKTYFKKEAAAVQQPYSNFEKHVKFSVNSVSHIVTLFSLACVLLPLFRCVCIRRHLHRIQFHVLLFSLIIFL